MARYVLTRLAQIPLVLLGLVTVIWLVVRLAPGDPVVALVGDFPAPDEYVKAVREEFGLDRSLPEQFLRYVKEQTPEVRDLLAKERKITPEVEQKLNAAIAAFGQQFKA